MKLIVTSLCLAALAALSPPAHARTLVVHTLREAIWAEVTCLNLQNSKLQTKRTLLSPHVGVGSARSFRLRVTELEAIEVQGGRHGFVSKLLDEQLGTTCVVELAPNQLGSVPVRDAHSAEAGPRP